MRRLKFIKRVVNPIVWLVLAIILAASARLNTAQAQTIDLDVNQSVTWIYGESVTFTVTANAPTDLVGAHLIFQASSADQVRLPVEIAGSANATVTATVDELKLPPAASFEYHWEFDDVTGQTYQGATDNGLYADNRVPWAWVPSSAGAVTILTDGSSQSLTQSAHSMVIAGQNAANQLLGQSIDGSIIVFVYPSLVTMANSLRAHGLIVEDWVAAYSIPEQQIIFVAAESGPDLMTGLERDIRHEVTHLAIASAAGSNRNSVPGWFNEGLAIYVSGENDPSLDSAISEAIDNRILPSLSLQCVATFATLPPREAALAYAQSASVIRFIVERYGAAQIANLMTAYAQGADCNQGVQSALGVSLMELESQWLRRLSSTEQTTLPSDNSLLPWFAAWFASVVLALMFLAPKPDQPSERSDSETRLSLPPVQSDPS